MYNHYWYPYPNHYYAPYSYNCIINSLQHVQKNQATIIHMLERLQNQITEIHSESGNLEQTHQLPISTHIHNEFDKFEIYLDSINISTLSGTMQIGLFNHGVIPGTVPSLQTTATPSAAVSMPPESAPTPQPMVTPQYGIPPQALVPPGYGLPPGVPPTAPGAIPGVSPGVTLVPPGSGLPPGVPPTAPEAIPGMSPGVTPPPTRTIHRKT